MKSNQKLGSCDFEVDTSGDVLEFPWLKIVSAFLIVMVWMAGFMVGAFCIYYLLAHFGRILFFLTDVCEYLAEC